MPQLVNQQCALCSERIASVVDAEFCQKCGNPVHAKCKPIDDASGNGGRCSACGGDISDSVVVDSRLRELAAASAAERARKEQLIASIAPAKDISHEAAVLLGALFLLVAAGLYMGHRTGMMPTFPFSWIIPLAIGSGLFRSAWS